MDGTGLNWCELVGLPGHPPRILGGDRGKHSVDRLAVMIMMIMIVTNYDDDKAIDTI